MIAARQIFLGTSQGNAEEEMYKELLLKLLRKELTEIDLSDELDATYGKANGARPFYGQSNLVKIRLRNLKTNNYSSNYLGDANNLRELWLDNSTWLTNSIAHLANVTYVYMPKVEKIQNPVNSKTIPGVFDFGNSRTCQQLLDSWATLFTSVGGNPSHVWTFRCSDGDVVWSDADNAWVKQSS